jgi:hypothetical protein
MKLAQSYSDGSVIFVIVGSIIAEDAISSARGRLAGNRCHAGEQWQISVGHESRLGLHESGTHQNRTFWGARRTNSGETGGRRTWDAGLCVGNPWSNQNRDERTRGVGNPKMMNNLKTRWVSRLGWEMEEKEARLDSN